MTTHTHHTTLPLPDAAGDALPAELDALGALLRHAGRVTPPAGMTSRIMAEIPLRRPGLKGMALDWFQRNLGASAWLPGRIMAATAGKCYLFFFFVSVLHVGMGAMLAAELHGYEHLFPTWMEHQPDLAYGLGALLLCMGMLLRQRTPRARFLAQLGLAVYGVAVLCNGVGIATSFAARGALLAAVSFAGCGVIMGSFLGSILLSCTGEGRHG